MKFISSFTTKAVSGGIDKTENRVLELVSRIYKNKFDYPVKVSDVKKTIDRKENTSTLRIVDISVIFVEGVVTEVQPANAPEAKEIIKEIKAKSQYIPNQL